jgi:hypothetical protein
MRHLKTFEQFVNEAKIENENIENSIAEFHQLQTEIAELEMQLKEKKNQFKQFDEEITPILDGMKETKDKLATTEEYVVKVSRFGHERTSSSYKDAFELALTKVNSATKKILEEALESTQKITNIGHSYKIEKLNEANIFQVVLGKLKSIAKSFLSIFKKESRNIDDANVELKRLSNSKMNESTVNEEVGNYMFFQNLKQIKENVERILALNENEVDTILSDGHAWAIDHVTTSKDDMEEVTNFLIHNIENPTV